MNEAILDTIRKSLLFRQVSEAGILRAAQIGILRHAESGSFYFHQDDPAEHAYVLVQGLVRMAQVTPDGHQITLRMMTPGQTFGGIAMLRPSAGYPASAQAVEDSIAITWATSDLRQFATTEPAIPLNTMELMHGYITELQERQKALVADRVEKRIARILLKLATETGKKVEEGILIDMHLSRQDVAEMSGTTLYTVSRTLSEWEREGMLKIGRERVIICEPHSLVRITDDLGK